MPSKVDTVVTVEGLVKNLDENIDALARIALTNAMQNITLKRARELAPGRGNLKRKLRILPPEQIEPGVFKTGLQFPKRYAPVEFGTEDVEKEIVPVHGRALVTPLGIFTRVMFRGQEGKAFARTAIKETANKVLQAVINAIARPGSTSNR